MSKFTLVAALLVVVLLVGAVLASGEKIIKNDTNVDVDVYVTAADGTPTKKGKQVGPVKIKAGGQETVVYGNDQNPYMSQLRVDWNDADAKAINRQTQYVTERGAAPTWDATLNTNSILTINAVNKFDVVGSNGGAVPPGSKRIVNKTEGDLEVILTPRIGGSDKATTKIIKSGETMVVEYGSSNSPYLSAFGVQWNNSKLQAGIFQDKDTTATGVAPTWDATLNTNNTLTITGVSAMKVTGSN